MSSYAKYTAKRLLMFFVVVIASLAINFIIPRLSPGDPIGNIISRMTQMGVTVGGEELIIEYRRMFGMEGDLLTQFLCYVREVFRGNLGYSISNFPAKVEGMIARHLQWTLLLLSVSATTSWLLGTVLGAIVGWRGQESKIGAFFAPIALVLYTIPYYMLAMILVFAFAYTITIFPISGTYTIGATPQLSLGFILDVLWHSTLPVLSIVLSGLGWWFLSARSMIMTLKGEDFILMAEAKGLSKVTIMWKHAFRNALLPQVTGLALSLGNIVGGALLTEVIFSYTGIGYLLYTAIASSDYPIIQGVTLLITLSVCSATFILDLIYPLIDPRIRVGE